MRDIKEEITAIKVDNSSENMFAVLYFKSIL